MRDTASETCPPASKAQTPVTRISARPKQILDALVTLRRLSRALNEAEARAAECVNDGRALDDLPAASLAVFATAEEKLADAGLIVRGEIERLQRLARGVAYIPPSEGSGAPRLLVLTDAAYRDAPAEGARR